MEPAKAAGSGVAPRKARAGRADHRGRGASRARGPAELSDPGPGGQAPDRTAVHREADLLVRRATVLPIALRAGGSRAVAAVGADPVGHPADRGVQPAVPVGHPAVPGVHRADPDDRRPDRCGTRALNRVVRQLGPRVVRQLDHRETRAPGRVARPPTDPADRVAPTIAQPAAAARAAAAAQAATTGRAAATGQPAATGQAATPGRVAQADRVGRAAAVRNDGPMRTDRR